MTKQEQQKVLLGKFYELKKYRYGKLALPIPYVQAAIINLLNPYTELLPHSVK